MDGYALPLTVNEAEKSINLNYDFIRSNKGRLITFSFEESSIDLAVTTVPRVVIDDIVYEIARQYFVKMGDTQTERIILLTPVMSENENPQLFGKTTGGLTSNDKPLTDGNGTSMYTSKGTLTNAAKEEVGIITEEIIDGRGLIDKNGVEDLLTEKNFVTRDDAKEVTADILHEQGVPTVEVIEHNKDEEG